LYVVRKCGHSGVVESPRCLRHRGRASDGQKPMSTTETSENKSVEPSNELPADTDNVAVADTGAGLLVFAVETEHRAHLGREVEAGRRLIGSPTYPIGRPSPRPSGPAGWVSVRLPTSPSTRSTNSRTNRSDVLFSIPFLIRWPSRERRLRSGRGGGGGPHPMRARAGARACHENISASTVSETEPAGLAYCGNLENSQFA